MVYNIFVFAIGATINEAVMVISAVVGILRFRKKENVPIEGEETI